MGIFSAVAKGVTKLTKAVTKSGAGKSVGKSVAGFASKAKRAIKAAPDFIFGDSADIAAKAVKGTKGSIFAKIKAGAKASIAHSERAAAKEGNFFKRLYKGLKSLPGDIAKSTKAGSRLAKMKGKNKILGGAKGLLKGIGKKMPFIGSALMIGFEVPNIYSATKDEGIWAGIKETGKAVARLAGGAVGAVAGTCLGGPLGGIAGFMGGEWLVSKLTGDTYSDKKEFLEEYGIDDQTIKELKDEGYSFDEIYDGVKEQAEQGLIQPVGEEEEGVEGTESADGSGAVDQPTRTGGTANPSDIDDIGQSGIADYNADGVAILKEYGLSEEDIAILKDAGIPYEDTLRLIQHIRSAAVGNTGGATSQVAQPQEAEEEEELLSQFVLPYQQSVGYTQPSANPYLNDTYYNLTFNNNVTNPFGSMTASDSQAQLLDMYKQNGRLGFSA